jgi:TolA-binding protein
MTRSRVTATLLPLLCLSVLWGCSDTEARERLRRNAAATWDSAVEVTAEAMGQAQAELERRLAELDPQIEELRARAQRLQGQARVEADRLLADLEQQRLRLREHVETLEREGAQAWQRMLREAQGELDQLSRRLDSALESTD